MIRSLSRPPAADAALEWAAHAPIRRIGLPAGLAAVQLVLAYEWLVSGVNKVVNPNFTVQPAGTIRDGLNDILIPLLSITLLVANFRAVRTITQRCTVEASDREWMPWAS